MKEIIKKLNSKQNLSFEESKSTFERMMSGKVRAIMEEFGDTTESLYLHIADNYDFRKPNKKKISQLLKTKI